MCSKAGERHVLAKNTACVSTMFSYFQRVYIEDKKNKNSDFLIESESHPHLPISLRLEFEINTSALTAEKCK